jgi:hypothetical protein
MNKLQTSNDSECYAPPSESFSFYSASQSRVAQENVALQKEQKCHTFAFHTCNEVRSCVLGIRKKEVGNTER